MNSSKAARVQISGASLLMLLGIQGGRICGGRWDENYLSLELLISHESLPEVEPTASYPLHNLTETIETVPCVVRRVVKIGETIVGDIHNDYSTT